MSNLGLYLASVLIWGSTWLVINFQLGVVATEVSVVYRFALAAVILFLWASLKGLKMRFDFKAHLRFISLGLFLFSFNYVLAYSAQAYIPSALNAIVFSSIMWMNVLNSRLFFGTPIQGRDYLAAIIGLAGLLIIFWPNMSAISLNDKTLIGMVLAFSGAASASFGNMVSSQSQRERLPILQSNAWGMFYGTILTAAMAVFLGRPFNFEYSFEYMGSMVYLVIFGSILGFGCYLQLLGRIGPGKAGYINVMFPVVAVLLSVIFEDLSLSLNIVLGFVLVILGNLMVMGLRRTLNLLFGSRAASDGK